MLFFASVAVKCAYINNVDQSNFVFTIQMSNDTWSICQAFHIDVFKKDRQKHSEKNFDNKIMTIY